MANNFMNGYGYNGYGFNYPSFNMQQGNVPYYNQQNQQTNTNKIFVSGIEEVKRYPLQAGSNMMFLDNDKSIVYEKIVDNAGKYEVNAYQLSKINDLETMKDTNSIDLSSYAKTTEIDALKSKIRDIENKIGMRDDKGVVDVQ